MEKRYIVCIDDSTEEQDENFIKYIKSKEFAWWHYLKNTWLLIDTNGKSNVTDIRDKVKECFDNKYNMIFQMKEGEGTWAGFGPKGEKRNMFNWLKNNW
nr:hypothetical protein [uncultured Draconibacterium sp.]